MVQIQISQCLSYREFPKFFRTHPTLICKSIFNASRRLQTKEDMLSDRPCRGGVLPAIINGYLFAYFSDPVSVCNVAGSELNGCYLCLVIVIIRNIKSRVRHAAVGANPWPAIGWLAPVLASDWWRRCSCCHCRAEYAAHAAANVNALTDDHDQSTSSTQTTCMLSWLCLRYNENNYGNNRFGSCKVYCKLTFTV